MGNIEVSEETAANPDAVDARPASTGSNAKGSRPTSARPTSARPTSARPTSGRPASGRPASVRPASGRPTSGRPASGRPTSGKADSIRVRSGPGEPSREGSANSRKSLVERLAENNPEEAAGK